ncbi:MULTISPECIES: antirestriction protein ArdA [Elizabethkingia]|nr:MULTISPECIES: antirestriction protein ArdA [Elizabethkingia]MCT3756759.1 antirestriction protein ArdA [Elizabethkingia anophelis]MCT3906624.1 antirestriction protein ArdA [Elizabethkingia anophelis]MCT4145333.1 antirestriction protein ArdA [Elizabethkingia anophelis]MCT4267149.1 antirestriction protein ArdA [Elizabethkingia anophelis]MCT4270697.1 antirestriction protein ArdA [Elizabethkingia anophelis]
MANLLNCLDTVSIYVGTYRKYNEGSLFGKWLHLSDYSDYNDLMEAMKELHKDEEAPEFMFQDYECSSFFINQKLLDEGYISTDIYNIALCINNSGLDFKIIEAYMTCVGYYYRDIEDLFESIEDAFMGEYDSDEDFAQHILEEDGIIPENLPSYLYIDWEMTAKHLMCDYSVSNGYYFRN